MTKHPGGDVTQVAGIVSACEKVLGLLFGVLNSKLNIVSMFQIEFFTMSDCESSLPSAPSGSGFQPPPVTTVAAPPGPPATTTSVANTAASVCMAGVPQQSLVYGSNSGQLGGSVSTTNIMRSSVSTPLIQPSTLDPGMLATIIQSGIIPPLQMAELQQKLSVMSMGGLSVGPSVAMQAV